MSPNPSPFQPLGQAPGLIHPVEQLALVLRLFHVEHGSLIPPDLESGARRAAQISDTSSPESDSPVSEQRALGRHTDPTWVAAIQVPREPQNLETGRPRTDLLIGNQGQ